MRVSIPFVAAAAALLLTVCLPAQHRRGDKKDRRDTVVLKSGKELQGRVLSRHEPDELMLMDRGKRVRVKHSKIQSVDTVRDQLRKFFGRRSNRDHKVAATHWEMAEWAEKNRLPHLAKIEAYATLVRDPDHEAAHEMLDHKKTRKGWKWRLDGKLVSKKKFDERVNDTGLPLELRSEHFELKTNVTLDRAVNTLLDLERVYLWWLDVYGRKLQLDEIIEPLPVKLFADGEKFPARTTERRPYFVPHPHNEFSFLHYFEGQDHPNDLVTVASQHILYRSLARSKDPGGELERFCAWLEIGISRWAQSRFQGEPGQIEPGEVLIDPGVASLALRGDRYSLKNMVHLNLRDHFYRTGSLLYRRNETRAEVHWAAVQMFVTFLFDENENPETGPKLLEYLHAALREGKGDSSRALDKALGKKIEKFERPWRDWMAQKETMTPPK